MGFFNKLDSLSSDYRRIVIAGFIATAIALIIMKLPEWMSMPSFWQLSINILAIYFIGLVGQFYYYSSKLKNKKLADK